METPIEKDTIFALDIGTRTVIGIICKKEGSSLKIIAESVMEHDSRSMLDGQVHDIDKVAQVVIKVKEDLEKKAGFSLHEVAVAAAGRTLKTKCVHVDQDLGDDCDIDEMIINSLEQLGVSQASKLIKEESKLLEEHFFCVGYSIVSYYLNGYPITSLLEHKGRFIGADVLATFLPQSVVNSLYKVLKKSSLTPISLTLEPIAALEAIVPENIRLLNIALIDIGAGTSDIAITRRGTISSYGMVPVAGDEVTEALAERYLLSFNTAETIKRSLSKKKKKVTFKDITGNKVSIDAEEILCCIKDASANIAKEISKAVLSYNGEPPKAIFCVGGGSMTPGLVDALSNELSIDVQRIAVKKRTAIPNLYTECHITDGPEGVTAVGIAIVAFKKVGHDFINVFVNGKECRLFNSSELTVKDVLGLIGYEPSSLIGRSGRSIRFTINGMTKRVSGEPAEPPEIYVNESLSSLETRVKGGDAINIKDAVNGKDAQTTISEQAEKMGITIFEKKIYVNGKDAEPNYVICDGDVITITDVDKEYEKNEACSINVNVNGKNVILPGKNHIFIDIFNVFDMDLSTLQGGNLKLTVNGKNAEFSQPIKDGDIIEITSL